MKNGVKNLQAVAYNGARTVYNIAFIATGQDCTKTRRRDAFFSKKKGGGNKDDIHFYKIHTTRA